MPKIREQRFYSYTFEMYVESLPQSFEEELKNLHCKVAYILHDRDKYAESDLKKYIKNNEGKPPDWKVGDIKKPHYHIVLKFENLKSIKGVLLMLAPLEVKYIEPVQTERGMIRYLIHIDDVEKYQYNKKDIVLYGGYNIDKFFESDKDINDIKKELRNILLKDNGFYTYNYFDFYNYIADNYSYEYLDIIDRFSYSFQSLIIGKNKKKEQDELKKAEEKRKENLAEREKELLELRQDAIKQTELRKLELKQKQYDKKEHFRKTYSELIKKENLDANEIKLKDTIEKFFIQYENEKDFLNIAE
ncbi:MAG: Rep family protein [Clostridiales bacterium]|nr:Rep family protein [Clostridiales bacterium]